MAEHTRESLSRRLNWLSLVLVPGMALVGVLLSVILSAIHALQFRDMRLLFGEHTIHFLTWLVPGCAAIGIFAVAFAQTVRLQVERSYYGSQAFSRADTYPCILAWLLPGFAPLLSGAVIPFLPWFWCIAASGCGLLWFLRRAGKMKRPPRPGAPGIALALWWLGWAAVLIWLLLNERDVAYRMLEGALILGAIYAALASLDLVSILKSHYDSQVKPPPEQSSQDQTA